MTPIEISLSDELRAFLQEAMARHGYADASEYIAALLSEARINDADEQLERELLDGIRSGPPTQMSDADWAAIRGEVEARIGRPLKP